MKNTITLLILFLTTLGFSRQGINYKTLIKDVFGNVAEQTVFIRFTILEDVNNVYQEPDSSMIDANKRNLNLILTRGLRNIHKPHTLC